MLCITVHEARGLPKSVRNTFCRISSAHGPKLKTRKHSRRGGNGEGPTWNDNFLLSMERDNEIRVELCSRSFFGTEGEVGGAYISLSSLQMNIACKGFFPIYSATNQSQPVGEICLTLCLMRSNSADIAMGEVGRSMLKLNSRGVPPSTLIDHAPPVPPRPQRAPVSRVVASSAPPMVQGIPLYEGHSVGSLEASSSGYHAYTVHPDIPVTAAFPCASAPPAPV
jgi:hypothetical protein